MVVVKLQGGLGNQMFQYAAGRALAHARRTRLKLDARPPSGDPARPYRLDHLNVSAQMATPKDLARFHWHGAQAESRAGLVRRIIGPRQATVVVEREFFRYNPGLFVASGDLYLDGYWQNERYFSAIADVIRSEFTHRQAPDAQNAQMLARIESAPAVAVHARRGDYVHDEATNRTHGACGLDYYQRCFDIMSARAPTAAYFIFSDDPDWAAAKLRPPGPAVVVRHNGPERDYEDLRLMSRCRHFIIANSTFSWWAAWLAAGPEKTVLAPRRWLATDRYDTSDLFPAGWEGV